MILQPLRCRNEELVSTPCDRAVLTCCGHYSPIKHVCLEREAETEGSHQKGTIFTHQFSLVILNIASLALVVRLRSCGTVFTGGSSFELQAHISTV
jgi:hypothetical protein